MRHQSRVLRSIALLGAIFALVWATPALGFGNRSRLAVASGELPSVPSAEIHLPALVGLMTDEVRESSITIRNDGSPGAYVLAAEVAGSGRLLENVQVTVTSGERTRYEGTLRALRRIDVGRLAASETRTLSFRVALRPAQDDLQGLTAHASFSETGLAFRASPTRGNEPTAREAEGCKPHTASRNAGRGQPVRE